MVKNKIAIHVPDNIYFGGDVLMGVVELNLEKKIKSRGVRMLFCGYEETSFQRQRGKTTVTYHETWIFLQYRMDLAGAPRAERKHAAVEDVEAGVYRWPFALKLPDLLAPSFKFFFGSRRYRISAYVDIPRAFDITKKMDIQVGGNIWNPYQFIQPAPPPEQKNNKKGFIFASGKLKMSSSIHKENYFVGDTVYIKLHVDNQSTKNVDNIKVTLLDKKTFYACGEQQDANTTIHRQKYDLCVPANTTNEFNLEFLIPNVPNPSVYPTPGQDSKLIEVRYWVIVNLDLPWAFDLKTEHNVNIMKYDPKVPGLPLPGPLIAPGGKKYITAPPPPPQSYIVASAPPLPPSPVMPSPYGGVAYAPVPPAATLYPQVAGYEFPMDIPLVNLESGEYKVEDDEVEMLR